jgi:hypothetical protein
VPKLGDGGAEREWHGVLEYFTRLERGNLSGVSKDVAYIGAVGDCPGGPEIGCGVRRIRPPSSAESDQSFRLNPATQFGVSDHLGEGQAAA